MSSIGKLASAAGASIDTGDLGKFIPEPRSRLSSTFTDVLGGLGSLATNAATGLGDIAGGAQNLLNQQIAVQMEMQMVSLESNLLKSKHETQMNVIRNVRVG